MPLRCSPHCSLTLSYSCAQSVCLASRVDCSTRRGRQMVNRECIRSATEEEKKTNKNNAAQRTTRTPTKCERNSCVVSEIVPKGSYTTHVQRRWMQKGAALPMRAVRRCQSESLQPRPLRAARINRRNGARKSGKENEIQKGKSAAEKANQKGLEETESIEKERERERRPSSVGKHTLATGDGKAERKVQL